LTCRNAGDGDKSFKVGKKESIELYLDYLLPGIILKWPEWWPKKV